MRLILACALCLIAPIAHAQSSYAEQESDRINNEIAAYQEGIANGRMQLQHEQEQGWSRHDSGIPSSGCR